MLRLSSMSMAFVLACSFPAFAEPPKGAEVNGFGGFFFRSDEPQSLAAWYLENLGIDRVPTDYETSPWRQEGRPNCVFAFRRGRHVFRSLR